MTFEVYTLGCKVNSYESEAVKLLLLDRGHRVDGEHPDLAVINTCSVTSMSEKKSRQLIRRLAHDHPGIIIALMGCYAQIAESTLQDLPNVGVIVGTSNRHLIPDLIDRYLATKTLQTALEMEPLAFAYEEMKVTTYTDRTRAYVKIQDGCDNFCAYCIIPYARGRLRSRHRDDVVAEIKHLTETGYLEIVLTGIHTAGYGRDLADYSFDDLLLDIFKACPDLHRLRISSIEASEISERFLTLLAEEPRLARHLHIPLQSGSDAVLAKMNRHYRTFDFVKTISRIQEILPDIALTTDIIVGFPGETDEDFETTYALAQSLGFSKIHVFPYSPRAGTAAAKMENQVHDETKKKRVLRLLELSSELERAYAEKWTGRTLEVIVEEYNSLARAYEGHSSNYLKVLIGGPALQKGDLVNVSYYPEPELSPQITND
jgi:threonylcarbamoyladenosine tRNA methylthiotransferase MtaB